VDLPDVKLNAARTRDFLRVGVPLADWYPSSVSYPSPEGELVEEVVDLTLEERDPMRLGEKFIPNDLANDGGRFASAGSRFG
jgi:hypothetical protein